MESLYNVGGKHKTHKSLIASEKTPSATFHFEERQGNEMIEELKRKLDSITGDDPVSNARRLAIIAMINELMQEQE